jgi:hypothetical protein
MTCTYVSVYLWTFQGEVYDFSEEVQKISEEVQNNLRGSAHLPTPPLKIQRCFSHTTEGKF